MFSRLLYYLLLLPLSHLPFRLLYFISDGLSWLLYNVFPYRKKVILDNITHAFPQMSDADKKKFLKDFYSHFSDLAVEVIKTLSISIRALNERMIHTNPELFNEERYRNRQLVLLTGHYGNWEWGAMQLSRNSKFHKGYGIYLPLNNKFFDGVIRKSRKKFGTHLISTREVSKVIGKDTVASMFAFIADQNPSNRNKCEWIPFFGREVPVAKGPEAFAKRLNAPVFYGHIEKIARGKYTLTYELIEDEPLNAPEGTITKSFINRLEEKIRKRPALWLWTHKRWKHKK